MLHSYCYIYIRKECDLYIIVIAKLRKIALSHQKRETPLRQHGRTKPSARSHGWLTAFQAASFVNRSSYLFRGRTIYFYSPIARFFFVRNRESNWYTRRQVFHSIESRAEKGYTFRRHQLCVYIYTRVGSFPRRVFQSHGIEIPAWIISIEPAEEVHWGRIGIPEKKASMGPLRVLRLRRCVYLDWRCAVGRYLILEYFPRWETIIYCLIHLYMQKIVCWIDGR